MSHISTAHLFLRFVVFSQFLFPLVLIEHSFAQPLVQNGKIITAKDDASKYIALFKMVNSGKADALIDVSSKDADQTKIYSPDSNGSLPVPAGNSSALSLDGAYIILKNIKGEMVAGRSITLALNFEKSGEVITEMVFQEPDKKAMDHAAKDHSTMDHSTMDHSKMKQSSNKPAPTLSIKVKQLPGSKDWQVHANVTGFEFSKKQVDGPHVQGIGHGHLYVDGIKIKRFYKPQTGFGELLPGKHIVRVTLNTNDHNAYANNGKKVTSSFEIEVY